jgi:hypothetical protein
MRALIPLLLYGCWVEESLIQRLAVLIQIVLDIKLVRQLCDFGLVRLRPHFHRVVLAGLGVERLIFPTNA